MNDEPNLAELLERSPSGDYAAVKAAGLSGCGTLATWFGYFLVALLVLWVFGAICMVLN